MEHSKIQWTDHTFNPWIGCTKVSPGCAHCYAENETFARVERKNGRELWGKGKARHRTHPANWKQPLKWNAKAERRMHWGPEPCSAIHTGPACKPQPRVFCASMADVLDAEVPIEWRADLLKLIHDTPNLDWLLLTKRPQNFYGQVTEAWHHLFTEGHLDAAMMLDAWLGLTTRKMPPKNVWLGTSVEDQPRANERIPELLRIPARIRFLSIEPMLGLVQFCKPRGENQGIHWAIFGGESGPGARPCNIEWIRDGVKQCRAAGVAPFVKQLGANPVWSGWTEADHNRFRIAHKKGGGGDMSEWPEDLRIREFPA
jgi:protein gp37